MPETETMLSLSRLAQANGWLDATVGVPSIGISGTIERTAQTGPWETIRRYPTSTDRHLLKEAVCALYPQYRERHIVITHGATGALMSAIMAFTRPGDRVGITEPYYPGYCRLIRTLGREPHFLNPPLSAESITQSAANANVRLVIVNTPNNPSGDIADIEVILHELSHSDGLVVVVDEVYSGFQGVRAFQHLPLTFGSGSRLIRVNSVSKLFGLASWRVGWCISDSDVASQIERTHEALYVEVAWPLALGVAASIQDHSAVALKELRDLQRYVWAVADRWRAVGVPVRRPLSGMYLSIEGKGYSSSVDLLGGIAQNCGLVGVPWSLFERRDSPKLRVAVNSVGFLDSVSELALAETCNGESSCQ